MQGETISKNTWPVHRRYMPCGHIRETGGHSRKSEKESSKLRTASVRMTNMHAGFTWLGTCHAVLVLVVQTLLASVANPRVSCSTTQNTCLKFQKIDMYCPFCNVTPENREKKQLIAFGHAPEQTIRLITAIHKPRLQLQLL